jgi:hypothetical protein
MKQRDLKYFLQTKLKKSLSNIRIFEEGIDLETQLEFEKKTKKLIQSESGKIQISISETDLFNESIPIEEKKQNLLELSFSDDVKAYRLIEKFQSECEPELKNWTALALQKSRAHIEHSLSNEERIYISSGLGGSGNKLRYFFVLTSKNDKPFNELHRNILKKEIKYSIEKHEGIIEDIIFYDYFVTIVCLIPLQITLDKIFESIIDQCNELGNFLSDRIIATNTEKFERETIEKILNNDLETIKNIDNQKKVDFFDSKNNEFDDGFLDEEGDDYDEDDFDDEDDDYDDEDDEDDDYDDEDDDYDDEDDEDDFDDEDDEDDLLY